MNQSKRRAKSIASALWLEIYAAVFARSQHEYLWRAMASLSDDEKHAIDLKAHAIITKHIEDILNEKVGNI